MDRAWDNQLDNMLDDLQATVHSGSTVHSGGTVQSSQHSSSVHSGTALNGGTVHKQHQIESSSGPNHHRSEETQQYASEWRSTDLGTTDLSSIEKVKSVSKISSSKRYEYTSSTSATTQQSIKKNINDLDYLLNNLSSQNSSRDVSPSLRMEGPRSEGLRTEGLRGEGSRSSFHSSRSEERREKLIQNTLSRTPSLNRGQRRPVLPLSSSRPTTPHEQDQDNYTGYRDSPGYSRRESNSLHVNQSSFSNSRQSSSSVKTEFQPVHTTPDPLTGRYADGRITPNHGFTRSFHDLSSRPVTDTNGNIPKRPDELLQTLGQEIDQRELEKINHHERVTMENMKRQSPGGLVDPAPVVSRTGPPVFYPTEEMYSTRRVEAAGSYKASSAVKSSQKESEGGGAAIIPICLPLCCAAPCVIL